MITGDGFHIRAAAAPLSAPTRPAPPFTSYHTLRFGVVGKPVLNSNEQIAPRRAGQATSSVKVKRNSSLFMNRTGGPSGPPDKISAFASGREDRVGDGDVVHQSRPPCCVLGFQLGLAVCQALLAAVVRLRDLGIAAPHFRGEMRRTCWPRES
jgi:hypothetical protein